MIDRILKNNQKPITESFGEEKAIEFTQVVKTLYATLVEEAPRFKSQTNRANFEYAVPALAIYRTLMDTMEEGQEEAFTLTREMIRRDALAKIEGSFLLRLLLKTIGKFKWLGRTVAKGQISLQEPDGWQAKAVESDAHIAYDVHRCGIVEYMKGQEATELVPIFCELDSLGAEFMKGLRFERSGTIADGSEVCDFRYYRG